MHICARLHIPLESALTAKHLSSFSCMSQLICHADVTANLSSPLLAIRSLRNRHGSIGVCVNAKLHFSAESACRYRQVTFVNVGEARLQLSESRIRLLRQYLSAVVDSRIDVSTVAAALALCCISSISSTFAALSGLASISLASQMSR